MGRPKLPKAEKRVPITHKVAPETPAKLSAVADELDVSVGRLIDLYADGPRPKKPKASQG